MINNILCIKKILKIIPLCKLNLQLSNFQVIQLKIIFDHNMDGIVSMYNIKVYSIQVANNTKWAHEHDRCIDG